MLENNPNHDDPIQERRQGARISPLAQEDMILVIQTSRLHPGPGNNPYTIDLDDNRNPISRHVSLYDDEGIGQAIRDALLGQL